MGGVEDVKQPFQAPAALPIIQQHPWEGTAM